MIAFTPDAARFVTRLACPKCGRPVYGQDAELFRGILTCEAKRHGVPCGQRWWATALPTGDVHAALRQQFDGDPIIDELIVYYGIPDRLTTPLFWQIALTGHGSHEYRARGSRSLLSRIASHFRRPA